MVLLQVYCSWSGLLVVRCGESCGDARNTCLPSGVGDKRVYLTIRQRMNGRLLVEAELMYDIHAGPMTS